MWILLGWGLRRGALKDCGPWIALTVTGVVLSLGSYFQWSYESTGIPLPYLLFKKLPLLGVFRGPSRMILLATVGWSVLVAVSFAEIRRSIKGRRLPMGLLGLLLCIYSWEMGLGSIGGWATPVRSGGVYERLSEDKTSAAVLELPVGITGAGDVTVNAQEFMLHQPLHGKPLVVGRPTRQSRRSLHFCENTDVVYELTHPHVLAGLYERKDLRGRLAQLKRTGREVLREHKIRYVLFHENDSFFSARIMKRYSRFLDDVLGPAQMRDDTGLRMYRIY